MVVDRVVQVVAHCSALDYKKYQDIQNVVFHDRRSPIAAIVDLKLYCMINNRSLLQHDLYGSPWSNSKLNIFLSCEMTHHTLLRYLEY